MPKLIVTDRKGERHELDATVGWSVMEVIRENNLPIEAACGGCCACATCHVYVDEALARPAGARELGRGHDARRGVRGSRQFAAVLPDQVQPALDGLEVTLAPEF